MKTINTSTSTVTDLQSVRAAREAKASGKKLVGDALREEFELSTKGLAMALTHVDRVVFFSGDVEEGGARKACICEGAQLLRVAKSQLYNYSLHCGRLRLSFDGDYIYDLYFNNNVTSDLLEKIVAVVKGEQGINCTKKDIQSLNFQISILQSGEDEGN